MENLDIDITDKIIQYLMNNPKSSSVEIAKGIKHNRITITKYLEVMRAYGVVDYERLGKARLWGLKKDKQTVLVVDDDISILNLVKLILSNNYNVITSESGEEALRYIDKANLAIIDLMMPGISGFELIKEIKKKTSIPLIVISAMAKMSDKIKALLTGADQYIVKPFDPLELESFVILALGSSNISPITHFPSKRLFLLKMRQLKRKPQNITIIKINLEGKELITYSALVGKHLKKHGIIYHPVPSAFCIFSDSSIDVDLSPFSDIPITIEKIGKNDDRARDELIRKFI